MSDRIDSLERDKRALDKEVDELRVLVDRLAPENARLREALSNAQAYGTLASSLSLIGGGAISYATFITGKTNWVAHMGAMALVIGVIVSAITAYRAK
jgi:hypothetical protein